MLEPHLASLQRLADKLLVEDEIEGEALERLLGEPVELTP